MAQIKALTPEGRLPTTAVTHVGEIAGIGAHPVITGNSWTFAETDDEGRISRAVDEQGRTWLSIHPDSQGFPDAPTQIDPEVAAIMGTVDSGVWSWVVTDEAGQIAFGIRRDGTMYPDTTTDTRPFDVVLIIGQSNAQGAGRPVIDTEVWPDIYQYPAASKPQTGIVPAVDQMPHQGPITSLTGHGPGIFFARDYAVQHPGRRVLLVPAAYSGTGFSSVGPNTWDWTSTEGGDNLAVRAVAQTQAALAAAGPGARLAGILWHQGEGDGSIPDTYATKLEGLAVWIRGQLSAPDVPFVVGQMEDARKGISSAFQTIDKAHISMPGRLLRCGFARSNFPALHNPGDPTHFSARGQMLLGASMYRAWNRARYNTDDGVAPLGVENLTARRVGDEVRVTWDETWSRALAYVVEWSLDGTAWQAAGVTQFAPLSCAATIAADPAVMHIRVTATNTYGSSAANTIDA